MTKEKITTKATKSTNFESKNPDFFVTFVCFVVRNFIYLVST